MKKNILMYVYKLCEKSLIFSWLFSHILYENFKNNIKLNEVIRQYAAGRDLSPSEIKSLKKDLFVAYHYYRLKYKEYFWYDFQHKDHKERKSFIGDLENLEICGKLNEKSPHLIFKDKKKTYDIFRKYFGREVLLIENQRDRVKFIDFAEKAGKIIVKPLDSFGGQGIFVLRGKKKAEDAFYAKIAPLLPGIKYIAEEYIQQDETISGLNKTSINTLRIATFIDGKDVVKLYACIRIGRSGECVDNASSGGMAAMIDINTGTVITGARNEQCQYFEKHPDTGTQILGFKIPKWQKALALAEELAMVMPQQRYVGWDLALTNNGWIMIEGNAEGPMLLTQLASQKGIRPVFEKTVFKYLQRI